jgi:calcineurin-like phosphoesterase family protein
MGDNAKDYFAQLNGQIKFLAILWHHDRRWLKHASNIMSKSLYRVEFLPPMHVINLEGEHIVLSHYPIGEWDRKHYGSWCLHGHSHCNYHNGGKILDVGVDCHNFYPWSFEEIKEYMNGH